MGMNDYSKATLLAAATNDRLIEVSIGRTLHEQWCFDDGSIGPHTTEGSVFKTYDLKTTRSTEQRFETVAEGEQRLFDLVEYEGFRPVTESEASDLMLNCPMDPLPEPPAGMMPGTYAYTAWFMAQTGMMTGDEADQWKDQMKDGY